jgi:preprotein translocase subunit SecG
MKTKFFILFFSLIFTFFFLTHKVYANIPECGNTFQTAGILKIGDYQGTPLKEEETCYLSINVSSGYEVSIDYDIKGDSFFGSVALYNSDEEELSGSDNSTDTLKWLGSHSDENKYYLKIENSYRTDSFQLNVNLIDRTDADTDKDAGNDFNNSTAISYGNYMGYLSKFIYGTEGGDDNYDYYKLPVNKDDKVSIKLTPESDLTLGCTIFDSSREELFDEDGLYLTAGQIVQQTLDVGQDGYIFIVIKWPYFDEVDNKITKYEIEIINENTDDSGGEIDNNTVAQENDSSKVPDKNTIKTVLYTLAVVLFIIIIIVIIVILSKKGKKKSNSSNPSIKSDKEIQTDNQTEKEVNKTTKEENQDKS